MDPAGMDSAASTQTLCQNTATGMSTENQMDMHHGAQKISFVSQASDPYRLTMARRNPLVIVSSATRRARRATASAAAIKVRTSTFNTLTVRVLQEVQGTCFGHFG